jgi:hypothetical protein
MIIIRSPPTLCVRRESRGVGEANLLVPRFSPFALFSLWEPGYEQTD